MAWLFLQRYAQPGCGTPDLSPKNKKLHENPTANLRPAAVSLGVTLGWGLTAAVTRHRFEVQKSLICLGCIMSVMSITSLLLFFKATDLLSQYDLGNIAVPLMVGSNILAFTLFSMIKIREKSSWKEWSTIAALLTGLTMLR